MRWTHAYLYYPRGSRCRWSRDVIYTWESEFRWCYKVTVTKSFFQIFQRTPLNRQPPSPFRFSTCVRRFSLRNLRGRVLFDLAVRPSVALRFVFRALDVGERWKKSKVFLAFRSDWICAAGIFLAFSSHFCPRFARFHAPPTYFLSVFSIRQSFDILRYFDISIFRYFAVRLSRKKTSCQRNKVRLG